MRRSPTTLIVHLSDDAPPLLEGAGPLSPETAERLVCDARRLTIKPTGRDLVHSRVGRCASYAQQRALHKRSAHCQYPGCTAARELEAHHLIAVERGGKTELDNLILLCPRHHKLLHDHHIRTSGNGEQPAFATKPDARSPPTSRTRHQRADRGGLAVAELVDALLVEAEEVRELVRDGDLHLVAQLVGIVAEVLDQGHAEERDHGR